MTKENTLTPEQIVEWQDKQPAGFHGIVDYPGGGEGYYYKTDNGFTFFPLGEGQDPTELELAAHELYDAWTSDPDLVEADYITSLGERVRALGKPKAE